MNLSPVAYNAARDQYERQAKELYEACKSGDPEAVRWLKERPHFWINDYDDLVSPKDFDTFNQNFTLDQSSSIIARWYAFENWQTLTEYAAAASTKDSAVWQFETAIEAIIAGDAET